ncbi:MAG: nitroreductase [Rubripirellula sp.]|nr:nitroreductase [Rubripirellula sp.]
MDIIEAIRNRASTRAFTDRTVPRNVIHQILDAARWAPSGVNTQPWQVAVITGDTKQKIGDALVKARSARQIPNPDYKYYPDRFVEPYRSRQKTCGFALYGALGIERGDKQARMVQWLKNYHGFGAPVELLFFVDTNLEKGSWLDMGMFIQNVMLAARAHDLETCPQAAMAEYPDIVREILKLPDSLSLVCGVAMGYPDREHPVNHYRTERESVEVFTNWFE